nr:hypothetical protein [uncultured Desulfuromonas sp.]
MKIVVSTVTVKTTFKNVTVNVIGAFTNDAFFLCPLSRPANQLARSKKVEGAGQIRQAHHREETLCSFSFWTSQE